jgi:hypothetical protein
MESTPPSTLSSWVGMPLPLPQLQTEPEGEVEDEMSSFKEVKGIQKKLVKEGNVEVVENPTFMTETRRKELERERLRRVDVDVNPGGEGR